MTQTKEELLEEMAVKMETRAKQTVPVFAADAYTQAARMLRERALLIATEGG